MPGTNAVYTFKDAGGTGEDRHVYDSRDAYPAGAAVKLLRASMFGDRARAADPALRSWSKTRAIADAIATGDELGSRAALLPTDDWRQGQPATNFRYEIEEQAGEVRVTALTPDFSNVPDGFQVASRQNFPEWQEAFSGNLREFADWARDIDHIGA